MRAALEELSIGDFVLSGGEIAALALIDALVRLMPGVMGERSVGRRGRVLRPGSWNIRITRGPQIFEGRDIPERAASGDHARIAKWRHEQALALTRARRPDLLAPPGDAVRRR